METSKSGAAGDIAGGKAVEWRWASHVRRMPEERLPQNIYNGELPEGRRSAGGPKDATRMSLSRILESMAWTRLHLSMLWLIERSVGLRVSPVLTLYLPFFIDG